MRRGNDPLDFELLIDRVGEGYRARVIGARGHVSFSELIAHKDLENFWRWCSSGGAAVRHLNAEPSSSDLAKEIGSALFRTVFAGKVGRSFDRLRERAQSQNVRLRVRLRLGAPELAVLPWELLYDTDEEEYLFRSEGSSILRSLDGVVGSRRLFVEWPVRMLVLVSTTPSMPHLELEAELAVIQEALASLQESGLLTVDRLDQPMLSDIAEAFREHDYHIVHFLGHGGFTPTSGGELYLGDAVDSDLIGEFLRHRPLRLVVLNACEGARSSAENPFSGVAQRLIQRGIPAVIAMQCPVEDPMAIAFSRHFYRFLAMTGRPGQALALTRQGLLGDGYRNGWAIPAFYMQAPDGQLFPPLPPGEVAKTDQSQQGPTKRWRILAAVLTTSILLGGAGFWISQWRSANPPECPSPPGLAVKFVLIKPGSFHMGEDHGDKANGPAHPVTITHPFCLAAEEVTQQQWKRVMNGDNPSEKKGDSLPVTRVSWNDTFRFFAKLNQKERNAPYRLPSEAEWELAVRAGSESLFSFGDDPEALPRYGNCQSGIDGPSPVGSFDPNPWKLYDMHGNVFEWVGDWFGAYTGGPATDPTGPSVGTDKVRRGGSWRSVPMSCRAADRSKLDPDEHSKETGFRIARDPIH